MIEVLIDKTFNWQCAIRTMYVAKKKRFAADISAVNDGQVRNKLA
jgi:hypothetical protein